MTTSFGLVEREAQLGALLDAIQDTSESGKVVLISGEGGHGKTSVVKAGLSTLDHKYTVRIALCEPVGIPTAFAPLYDIIGDLPGELSEAIRSGKGVAPVGAGLLDFLKQDRVVLVMEDIHWADEATLGLVRYLGRRIDATNSCLVLTYRSEHLDVVPPLRLVVADLGPGAVRIDLPSLSVDGVAQMAAGQDLDPAAIHAASLGNPFLVEEIVRHPELDLPPTVQNAVLAITDTLSSDESELVGLVALSRDGLTIDVLTDLMPAAEANLSSPLRKRVLTCNAGVVGCRHELIRESLVQAMSPVTSQRLHAQLLEALEGSSSNVDDVSRLAYHAVGANDNERAREYSTLAGDNAARVGAHRQASLHFVDALAADDGSDPKRRAQILLTAAMEDMTVNNNDRACAFAFERIELAQSPEDEAKARAWLSFFLCRKNDLPAGRSEASRAIEVLEELTPTEELAVALTSLAWLDAVDGNAARALKLAGNAEEVARQVGARKFEVKASLIAGRLLIDMGDSTGPTKLDAVARLAVSEDLGEFAATAVYAQASARLNQFALAEAVRGLGRAAEYASSKELDAWYVASIASRATANVWLGKWGEADHDLEVVEGQHTCIQTEVEVLVATATLRLLRGDPGAADLVRTVLDRASGSSDRWILETTTRLALEAAWVGVVPIEQAVGFYDRVVGRSIVSSVINHNDLTFWANRLNLIPPQGECVGPARFEESGDYQAGAEAWNEAGFAIETIITRALTPEADLQKAFAELEDVGAEGVATGLRRELQRRGFHKIPRGTRSSTRKNKGRLTNRESEVLSLMATGMSNAAIGEELYISEKTASHHVSSILTKLSVSNRTEAVAVAASAGWLELTSSSS